MAGEDCSADAGFLRDDAMFDVIVVSDQPDQSALTPDTYVDYFWALKGDPGLVRINAIAGTVPGPPSCGTCSSPGYGYDEAVELTSGRFLDVCASDWTAAMVALAEDSFENVRRLLLTSVPVADTIEVDVNGVPVEKGWTYIGDYGVWPYAVWFDLDSLPAVGSAIEVRYPAEPACD